MVVGESASLSESLAEVEIVPRPERIPEEERNDEELLCYDHRPLPKASAAHNAVIIHLVYE